MSQISFTLIAACSVCMIFKDMNVHLFSIFTVGRASVLLLHLWVPWKVLHSSKQGNTTIAWVCVYFPAL